MYLYKGQEYSDLFSLAEIMYLDIPYFANALKEKELIDFISSQNEEKSERISKLLLLSLNDDILVFKASYILSPFMSFRFRGLLFSSYEELGNRMFETSPDTEPVIMEAIRYSLISQHMLFSHFYLENPEFYNQTISFEKKGDVDLSYSYFLIAYYLSGKKSLVFHGKEYRNLFNFVYYLNNSDTDKEALGKHLSSSPLLRAYSFFSPDCKKISEYLHLNSELNKSELALDDFLQNHEKKRKNSLLENLK